MRSFDRLLDGVCSVVMVFVKSGSDVRGLIWWFCIKREFWWLGDWQEEGEGEWRGDLMTEG